MKNELELIAEERQRQIDVYGYSDEHIKMSPDDYAHQELAGAAATYAIPAELRDVNLFPWSKEYWKPSPDNRIMELVKAAAMLVAEIDRLNNTYHYTLSNKYQNKPETAQEAAERTCNEQGLQLGGEYHHKKAFVEGAHWQSTQMFSREDVEKMLEALRQRCAEEAKTELTSTCIRIDKQSILSVEYKDLIK